MPISLRPLFVRLAAAISLAALAALAPAARAQEDANVQRGFAAEKVYAFGEIDSVNLFNGNLVLTIPIGGGYPVNGGLGYSLKLVYNSNIWDFHTRIDTLGSYTWATISPSFNAGVGWTLSLGRMYAPNHPDNPSASGAYTFVGEDGGSHEFYQLLHEGDPSDPSTVLYSRDGSYLRLKLSSWDQATQGYLVADVESPDGTVRRFTRTSGDWSVPFRLASITDAFGNTVTITDYGGFWEIRDGHRIHYVQFAGQAVDGQGRFYVTNVDLAAAGGTRARYDFTYQDLTFDRHPSDTDGTTGATTTAPVLSTISLPDGSFWRMPLYHTTAAAGPGLIQRLELPTLGKIDWTWRGYTYPSRSDGVGGGTLTLQSNYGVATKRVLTATGACQTLDGIGCEWTYSPQGGTGALTQRIVRHPTGDETVHHFATPLNVSETGWTGWEYGLPFTTSVSDGQGRYLSQEIYDGSVASGVKKRSIYLRYERDKIPQATTSTGNRLIQDWYNTNRRVASEKTVYHDDPIGSAPRFSEVTHLQFDGLGHYRQSRTDGNFDGGNVRTTYTGFNPGSGTYQIDLATNQPITTYNAWPTTAPWVLATFPETWQSEGTATAKQQYCFQAATGALLRKRILSGTSPAATDLLTAYTYDTSGNVVREQHYGGDVQALDTGALCTLGLPGDQYRVDHTYSRGSRATSRWMQANGVAMPFYTLQLAIDANTGLPTSAWDISGIRTDYEYDKMGRLTWEKPAAGHGAWTEYAYSNAAGTARASVIVRRRDGSKGGAILTRNWFLFDFMGRLATEQVFDAGGSWRTKNTAWNSMGWKRTVSETGSSWTTHFKSYDPFGRPQTITPPDGSAHDISLSYKGVSEVRRVTRYNAINQLSTTTERYDRQGRLYQVVEPAAPGGGSMTASYAYDVGGRLSAVFMTGGGLSQGREFTYDNRGLLLRERHPEKGPSGNGYVRYFGYDALGNPGRKVDAVGTLQLQELANAEVDLTFTYDRASRLTHQYAKGVIFKTFEYGAVNGTGDWSLGRLVRATRHNYVWLGPTPYHIPVEETYVYGGPGGAASARTTQAYNGPASVSSKIEGFTQGWAYDQLGNVTTLTYPRCISGPCYGATTVSRIVSFGYTNGWLTSVPGYAGSIGYHPNGMVSQVVHDNGATYRQEADPNGMRRPSSYSVVKTADGTPMWQSGTYAYDGSGNITAIGGATYTYDAVSRLVSGTVFTGPLAVGSYLGQSATYDAFGNLTSLSTEKPAPQGWSTLNLSTSASTNRLTSYPYDNSGAMTAWTPGTVYDREDLGLIWRHAAAGFAYIHLYTADDERIWTFHEGQNRSRWVVRDLDGKLLREFDNNWGTWTVVRDYVYREGVPLAAVTSTGHVTHLHPDHLGTPRLITLGSQFGTSQLAFHAYYPYGVEATAFNQDQERMKFTGHERDLGMASSPADDVDYMHARYYGPQVGRFLNTDPKHRHKPITSPQLWNRYSYAANNSIKHLDPDGEDLVLAFDFKGSGVGINDQLRIAYAVRSAFRKAGVQRVNIQFRSTAHRRAGKNVTAPIRFRPLVTHNGREVFGRTSALTSKISRVSSGLAPPGEPNRTVYFANVAAHEVGHQFGLHVFHDHAYARPGTLMARPASLEAISTEFLAFSELDAAVLRDALNEEDEEQAGTDDHGSVFGERMQCSRGAAGDNFCG